MLLLFSIIASLLGGGGLGFITAITILHRLDETRNYVIQRDYDLTIAQYADYLDESLQCAIYHRDAGYTQHLLQADEEEKI